jgi:hypothetical protein
VHRIVGGPDGATVRQLPRVGAQKPGGDLDYAAFATRIIRAHGRRIGQGDIEALPDLLDLAEQLAADR